MILVMTPLPLEKKHLEPALPAGFRVVLGGHGKVAMALSTQNAILQFKPRLVICAGAAGGLSTEVRVFDVVVGSVTVEHDFNLRFVKRAKPAFRGAPAGELPKFDFTVHVAPIASGDEDIVTAERAAEIHSETGAVAVAWEGAGCARACELHGVPFLEVRGISDLADANAGLHFAANLERAINHVAQVLTFLSHLGGTENPT